MTGETGPAGLAEDRRDKWEVRAARPGDEAVLHAKIDPTQGGGAGAANAITHHGHQRQIQDLIDALRAQRPLAIDGHPLEVSFDPPRDPVWKGDATP